MQGSSRVSWIQAIMDMGTGDEKRTGVVPTLGNPTELCDLIFFCIYIYIFK